MNEKEMLTWRDDDSSSKESAMAQFADNVDSYAGLNKMLPS